MTEYVKTIVNATTGEVLEEPMSQEEIDARVAEINRINEEKALALAEKERHIAARARAEEKLAALGLTEEEISALIN
jgi:hypothetical protein